MTKRAVPAGLTMTSRDLLTLKAVGEQHMVRYDVLGWMLGQVRGSALSAGRVRALVYRWRGAGWVAEPVRARVPGFVWLSDSTAGRLGFSRWEPGARTVSRVEHLHACGVARVLLEGLWPAGEWTSERRLRMAAAGQDRHFADGVVRVGGLDVAVEVELSRKQRFRVESAMGDLDAQGFDRQVWLVSYASRSQVLHARDRLPSGLRGRVFVWDLPQDHSTWDVKPSTEWVEAHRSAGAKVVV